MWMPISGQEQMLRVSNLFIQNYVDKYNIPNSVKLCLICKNRLVQSVNHDYTHDEI